MASAQWSYRLPWRSVLKVLLNWRWWPAVLLAALLAVALPAQLFVALPSGTVSAQVWHVSLKLTAAYLLAVAGWVLLMGWEAVLFHRQEPSSKSAIEPVSPVEVPQEKGNPAPEMPLSESN
jgi:hypothetical protein